MSVYKTFPLFQINASGCLVPVINPAAVELWSTGAGAAKLKDLNNGITNNNDGTYQVEISDLATGVYQIKVDFGSGLTEPDELNNIRIEGYDTLVQSDADNVSIEYVGDLHVKADGIKKEHVNADVAGTGLRQNVNGSLEADIDDAAGNGDTDKLWSANKIYDQLALKADDANIGDRNYTEENVVTDSESLTNSIDALDRAIGRFDWEGTTLQDANPASLIKAIKNLAYQVARNFQMIAGTTELQFQQELISDHEIADAAADISDASITHTVSGAIYQNKYRVTFYKGSSDRYLKLRCLLKTNNASYKAWVYLKIPGVEEVKTSSINTNWDIVNLTLDISSYTNGTYIATVGLSNENASGVSTLKSVILTKSTTST